MSVTASTSRVVEGARELVEERLHARVAVRLEDHDGAPRPALPGGGQRGEDLDRVVAVVVDHHDDRARRRAAARRQRRSRHLAAGRSGTAAGPFRRDRRSHDGAQRIARLPDYSHPVFAGVQAPRSGDFSAAHVFRYRALQTTPTDRVMARYDDGAVAAAEKKIGGGRSIVWTTTLDDS